MRVPLGVILSTSILLACCVNHKENAIINRAESLLQTRPDSSLLLLKTIDPDKITSREIRAKYYLFLSASLDKNKIDITSDSLIGVAIDYFSTKGSLQDQMMAWYYLGIIQKNSNAFPSAVVSFEKAAKKAEELGDSRYLGLIYRNIATSFYQSHNIASAISYLNYAVSSFEINPADSLYLLYAKSSLAVAYSTDGNDNDALSILEQIKDSNGIIRIPKSQALYIHLKTVSDKDYQSGINQYKLIPPKHLALDDYRTIALAYHYLGKNDSSDFWLNRSYIKAANMADTAAVDYTKSKILLQRGKTEEAYHLLNHATMVQDSLTRVLLGESVSAAQRDYFREEATRQEEKLVLTRKLSILLGVISLLIAVFFLFVLTQQSRKKDQALKEIMAQLAIKNQHLTQLSRENASLLATHYSERIRHIDSIAREYYQADSKNQKDIVFKQFKDYIGGLANDTSFYESIENDLNKYCSSLMSKVRSQLPNRPERNYRLLMLFFAGLSYETIAIITKAQSINSLKTMRSRLRKFIEESSVPDKALFLEMLETKRRPGVI